MALDMATLKKGDWVRCIQRYNTDARMLEVGKTYAVAQCFTHGLYVRDERGAESNYLGATQFEQIHNEEEEEMANKENIKVGDWVKLLERNSELVGLYLVGERYKVVQVHDDGVSIQQNNENPTVRFSKFSRVEKVEDFTKEAVPKPDSKHARTEAKEEKATMDIKVGDFAKVLQIEETSNFKVGETYLVDDVDVANDLIGLRTNDNRYSRWFDTDKVKKQVIVTMDAEEEEEMVHHPKHYERNDGSMETIQYMETVFGTRALITYCIINSFKYRDRAPFKGKPVEDNEKCAWYLKKAEELASKLGTDSEEFPLDAL